MSVDVFGEPIEEVVEEDFKRKKYTLFGDFVPDLTINKTNILRQDDEAHKDYSPYIICKFFSMGHSGIFFANEVNRLPNMSKKMSYDFFIHAIRKGKMMNPWAKADKKDDDLLMLMDYYQINERVAEQYLGLISDDDLMVIREDTTVGGRQK